MSPILVKFQKYHHGDGNGELDFKFFKAGDALFLFFHSQILIVFEFLIMILIFHRHCFHLKNH